MNLNRKPISDLSFATGIDPDDILYIVKKDQVNGTKDFKVKFSQLDSYIFGSMVNPKCEDADSIYIVKADGTRVVTTLEDLINYFDGEKDNAAELNDETFFNITNGTLTGGEIRNRIKIGKFEDYITGTESVDNTKLTLTDKITVGSTTLGRRGLTTVKDLRNFVNKSTIGGYNAYNFDNDTHPERVNTPLVGDYKYTFDKRGVLLFTVPNGSNGWQGENIPNTVHDFSTGTYNNQFLSLDEMWDNYKMGIYTPKQANFPVNSPNPVVSAKFSSMIIGSLSTSKFKVDEDGCVVIGNTGYDHYNNRTVFGSTAFEVLNSKRIIDQAAYTKAIYGENGRVATYFENNTMYFGKGGFDLVEDANVKFNNSTSWGGNFNPYSVKSTGEITTSTYFKAYDPFNPGKGYGYLGITPTGLQFNIVNGKSDIHGPIIFRNLNNSADSSKDDYFWVKSQAIFDGKFILSTPTVADKYAVLRSGRNIQVGKGISSDSYFGNDGDANGWDSAEINAEITVDGDIKGKTLNIGNKLTIDKDGNINGGNVSGKTATFTSINAEINGNAATADKLKTPIYINGVEFDGSADITVKSTTTNKLMLGNGLDGDRFDGSVVVTASVKYGTTSGTATQGNDVRLLPADFKAYDAMNRARESLMFTGSKLTRGTGNASYVDVSWDDKIISIFGECDTTIFKVGCIEIPIPASGMVIKQHGGNSVLDITLIDNFIPLHTDWCTLYWEFDIGGDKGDGRFHITAKSGGKVNVPYNWIRICSLNSDYKFVTWGDGTQLPYEVVNGVILTTSPTQVWYSKYANTLVTARKINGVDFDGSSDITVKASTTNPLTIGNGLTGTSFDGSSAVSITVKYGTTAGTATQGNDVRLLPADFKAYDAMNRARKSLMFTGFKLTRGTGNASYVDVSWDDRIISIFGESDTSILPSGYIEIPIPVSGVVVKYHSGGNVVDNTLTDSYIPLNVLWASLYWEPVVGGGKTEGFFHVLSQIGGKVNIPYNWINLCSVNGDYKFIIWGDGCRQPFSINEGTVLTVKTGQVWWAGLADNLTGSRKINNVIFDNSSDITVKASTTNPLTIGSGLTGTSFDGSSAVSITVKYGTAAGTAVEGNDGRLPTVNWKTINAFNNAKIHINGGGSRSVTLVDSQNVDVSWSSRFVSINGEWDNVNFKAGYIDISPPSIGTTIYTHTSTGVTSYTLTSTFIRLYLWDTLYWDSTIGGDSTAGSFRVVKYSQTSLNIPINWIRICSLNGDNVPVMIIWFDNVKQLSTTVGVANTLTSAQHHHSKYADMLTSKLLFTTGSGFTAGNWNGSSDYTPSLNFTTSGGINGVATTVARGDHLHAANQYFECSGTPNRVIATLGNYLTNSFTGNAWDSPSGVYRYGNPGYETGIGLHFTGANGSTPSVGFKAESGNGGLWYRTARDINGWTAGWDEVITSNKPQNIVSSKNMLGTALFFYSPSDTSKLIASIGYDCIATYNNTTDTSKPSFKVSPNGETRWYNSYNTQCLSIFPNNFTNNVYGLFVNLGIYSYTGGADTPYAGTVSGINSFTKAITYTSSMPGNVIGYEVISTVFATDGTKSRQTCARYIIPYLLCGDPTVETIYTPQKTTISGSGTGIWANVVISGISTSGITVTPTATGFNNVAQFTMKYSIMIREIQNI